MKKLQLLIEKYKNTYTVEIKNIGSCIYGQGHTIDLAINDLRQVINDLHESYERDRSILTEKAVKLLTLLKELREFWG